MPSNDVARAAVKAHLDLKQARDDLRRAGIEPPMALDSATSVYAHGLDKLGVSGPDRAAVYGSVQAQRQVFAAAARNPAARAKMALDAAATGAAGFAERFPSAAPVKVI